MPLSFFCVFFCVGRDGAGFAPESFFVFGLCFRPVASVRLRLFSGAASARLRAGFFYFRAAASEGRHERRELRAFAADGCGPPAFGREFVLCFQTAATLGEGLPALRAAGSQSISRCSVSCAGRSLRRRRPAPRQGSFGLRRLRPARLKAGICYFVFQLAASHGKLEAQPTEQPFAGGWLRAARLCEPKS